MSAASTPLRLFTSESVTEGHPDKICDQISDSILDALLTVDPHSRVAVETLVTTGLVHVAGEVTTSGYVDIPTIVRDRIWNIGYNSSDVWFDGRSCGVSVSIGGQSPDIAQGVDDAFESREESSIDDLDRQGAGDQGIMFGYATTETPEYMPVPIWLAHRLAERLAEVRKTGMVDYLRPDGKTQVTVGYDGIVPRTVETVVLSTQHSPQVSTEMRSEPPRGRSLQRQGPVEGGPLGGLRDALGREERRRSGSRGPPRGAGRLRHRQGGSGGAVRRILRNCARRRGVDHRRHPPGVRSPPGCDHP